VAAASRRLASLLDGVDLGARRRRGGRAQRDALRRRRPNVEVGVEVTAPFAPSERVVASPLPAGRAATTVVCGAPSREGLAPGHAAVVAWARAHAHELTGTPWEVYDHWRDDPDGFETAVFWRLGRR
jgi:hypothetical protein